MNTKKEIYDNWLKAKKEREDLEEIINKGEVVNMSKYRKLFGKAIEKEKEAYFQLTGKPDPKFRKEKRSSDTIMNEFYKLASELLKGARINSDEETSV